MDFKKNKNTLIIFLLLSFMFFSVSFFYKNFTNNIYYGEADYIADFDDSKKVSGSAENIFVGEVLENLGKSYGESGLPVSNTNFKINILYNIKGKLKGDITVTQEAGYDDLGNLFVMSKGDDILKKGDIYLLSTIGDKYTIISHPNGTHLLASNMDNKMDLKNLIKQNKKVQEFKQAYKNEVYYQDNFKISSEKNSYKSLSTKDKLDFENIENGFVEEYLKL